MRRATLSNSSLQRGLYFLIVTLFWYSMYVYIPYQTPYLTGIGVTAAFVGVVVGCYGFSQMIMRIPLGICADLLNKKKLFLFLGPLLACAASVIRVLTMSGPGFLFANFFSGLAAAFWITLMTMFLDANPIEKQQKASSDLVMFNNVGMMLGFIVSRIFYESNGMKFLCVTSIAAACTASFISLFIHEEPSSKERHSVRELLAGGFSKRLLFFSLLALIQQGIQMATTMSFTTQILKDLNASSGFIGASSIYYMAMAVLCAWISARGSLAKKGPKVLIPTIFMLLAVYCIAVPRVGNIGIIFALQTLPAMATGFLFSYMTGEAMKGVAKFCKSTAMGLYQAIYALGMTTLPIIVGQVADSFSMSSAFSVLAGLAAAAGIAALIFYLTHRAKI